MKFILEILVILVTNSLVKALTKTKMTRVTKTND